ncbi:MAG: phosphate acetyltransferase [Planctomycetes bacterium]|nr:phosphate acetyltransferase [Planctomycetota bacterium]
MSQGVYIAGTEAQNGKSVVVLALMEHFAGHGRKAGLFRPVIRHEEGRDSLIHLINMRYTLEFPYEAMYGCNIETARSLITEGRIKELYSLILEKYKALEKQCDFVLSVGTDYTGVSDALEFDFNVDVANHLGCLVLPVIKGHGRKALQLAEFTRALLKTLKELNCSILAAIVNRVIPEEIDLMQEELNESRKDAVPVYVVPEHPVLGKPTIGEIASALKAEWISRDDEAMDREVTHFKVAAMELPNFLDHLEDGSLIITPGDRSDMILGSILSDTSDAYPRISGLLLSGNLKPAPQVERLIEGLHTAPVPVFMVGTDTFTTTTNASKVSAIITPESKRKIAAALGIVEAHVDIPELEKRISGTPSKVITPLMFEYKLISRAKKEKQHIVLPEGLDERILRAAEILLLRGVADITLLGDPEEINHKINTLGLSLNGVDIINPADLDLREKFAAAYFELRRHKGISEQMAYDAMADVSYFGTMMVHHGKAGGMVSGAVHTTQHTIRPAFEVIKTKPGCSIVSSVFLMCLADRVLVYGDCAVNPRPTAAQLADIAISSAETAQMFGIEPCVAMLSYSTGESGKGEDVEKVREAAQLAKQMRPDLKLEGPIQYDAAVDATVAKTKMPGSDVAGHATVFIFPDLNTGNNTYKAVQRSAGAVAIGPILQGLNKPVNDLSRGCTVPDIVNTIAITAIQAREHSGGSGSA